MWKEGEGAQCGRCAKTGITMVNVDVIRLTKFGRNVPGSYTGGFERSDCFGGEVREVEFEM